jgi:hypothetical protein
MAKQPVLFREYYVLFTNSEHLPKRWRWFTRPRFEHCALYVSLDEDRTLGICQNLRNVEINEFPYNVHVIAEALALDKENTVVYVPRIVREDVCWKMGLLFPTCVAMCQRYMGLTFHAFTPYYYFKALVNGGYGFVVKECKTMGKALGISTPKPDQSLIKKQEEEARLATERAAQEKEMQDDLVRRQRQGKRSLLGANQEGLGVL